MTFDSKIRATLLALSLALGALPASALACACGCGVFGVGAGTLMPTGQGGTAFVEYDFMDQDHNRHGASSAPAADNSDKEIKTDFFNFGGQYMFNRSFGVMVQSAVWNRSFRTLDSDGVTVDSFHHTALGDTRIQGVYTGLSPDLSSGLTLGVKLPTGDFHYANFDPDTEIGTGSTDLLLGGYTNGKLTPDNSFSWFANAQWQKPLAWRHAYKPGEEVNAGVGVYYAGYDLFNGKAKLSPVVQLVGSWRARDGGTMGHPGDSGYERLLLAPGVELNTADWRLYAHVAFPVYQRVNGDQLTAPVLFKLSISRNF